MSNKLSAIVIAKNEEEHIGDCLKALSWADEIVVVDTGSTDKTVQLAKKHGAIVVNTRGGSFNAWREKGLKNAGGEWLLYVDADERVTPKLHREIAKLLKGEPAYPAYAIPRRNFIFGKEFKHSGQWPDYVKRLFKRSTLKGWSGELHEEPRYLFQGKEASGQEGTIGHLTAAFIHYKHKQLGEMVEKTNKWSEIEAKLMFDAGHPPMNLARFGSAIVREFWLRMVRQLAFLDGGEGIIYAMYQVYSRFISYAKLWELQEMKIKQ